MLSLANKGHLSTGADADITVYDPVTQKAVATFVGGTPVMLNGKVICKEGCVIAHPNSEAFLTQGNFAHQCVEANLSSLKQLHA